jgi:hypothetical protein
MLSEELQHRLAVHSVVASDETTLRQTLEAHLETYTLVRLAPWPARRWQCRYRLMTRDGVYDGQSIEDAYALGLLVCLDAALA